MRIDDFIYEFAKKIHLTEWDYFAFGLALGTIIVAGFTLYYQRRTEKNTAPVIKKKVQFILFKDIVIRLFDSYIKLNAIDSLFKSIGYKGFITREYLFDLLIQIEKIHPELYYDDENQSHYIAIDGISMELSTYNAHISYLYELLQNNDISSDYKQNYMTRLIKSNVASLNSIIQALYILFDYDLDGNRLYDWLLIKQHFHDEKEPDFSKSFITNEDPYILLLKATDKKELIHSMNERYKCVRDQISETIFKNND